MRHLLKLSIALAFAWAASACTPASGYTYCRTLTIAQVTANLTAFPVGTQSAVGVMTLGSSRLQNANCYDVVFTSDSGGTTLIPWEVETCNQSIGAVLAWFPLTLSSSSTTLAYVSYGNASVSTAQNTGSLGPTHVWDANFKAVWHLKDNAASTAVTDSTGTVSLVENVNTSTVSVAGVLGNGFIYDGSTNITSGSSANIGPIVTVSGFLTRHVGSATFDFLSHDNGGGNNGWRLSLSASHLQFTLGAVSNYDFNSLVLANTDEYNYFAVNSTGNGGTASAWLGKASGTGGLSAPVTAAVGTMSGTPNELQLGHGLSSYFNGKLDEIRISNIARPSDWITAEYANMNGSSTFVGVGSETGGGGGGARRRAVVIH